MCMDTKTKNILITILTAGTILGGIELLSLTDYQDLKIGLITKQQDWQMCMTKGEPIFNDEGVITSCVFKEISYEPFTPQDLQVLAVIIDKEIKKKVEKSVMMQNVTNANSFDKVIEQIK